MLNDTHRKIQERIKKLSYLISHATEQCEAKADEINSYLQLVAASGILQDHVILGPVLIDRAYPPESGRTDSAILYQAALDTRQGLGVLHWDMEEYAAARDEGVLEPESRGRFESIADCEPLLRALLFPHVESLLERLIDQIAHVERHTGSSDRES